MSNTNFSDSHPAGHELFSDSESYMTPLSSDEIDSIHGGGGPFDDWGDVIGAVVTGVGAAGTAFAAFTSPTATPASPPAVAGAATAALGLSYQAVKEAYD